MANTADSLFDLVKALKKIEVQRIKKKLLSADTQQQQTVMFQLFNLLLKAKTYNGKEIYRALQTLRKKQNKKALRHTALKVHKANLKAYILQYLANNSDNKIREWHEKLEAIQILTQRGLANEALHQIKLFKNEIEPTRYRFYITAVNYYMAQVLQLTGDAHLITRSVQLADENVAIYHQLYTTSKIYAYYINAFNLQLGGHLISDKKSLEKLNQLVIDPIRHISIDLLRYEDKYFLLNALLIVSRLEANYQQSMVYVRKLWQQIQDKWKAEAMHGFTTHITFLSEYLESAFQAKLYSEMAEILPRYKALIDEHQPTNQLSNGFYRHFSFLLILAEANNSKLESELESLSQFYKRSPLETPVIVRKRIEIDLAYGYYQVGKHQLAIQYLEAIMGLDSTSDIGLRIKDFLILYSLLIYFDMLHLPEKERLDLNVFETKLKAFSRRMQAKSNTIDIRIETAFIRFFNFYLKNVTRKKECIEALEKLRKQLVKFESEKVLYLLQINNSIHLTQWAETKQKELVKKIKTPTSSNTTAHPNSKKR